MAFSWRRPRVVSRLVQALSGFVLDLFPGFLGLVLCFSETSDFPVLSHIGYKLLRSQEILSGLVLE